MMKAHVNQESAVPWWAAFGAPLIGVPLLIVLLALGAPGEATGTKGAVETGYAVDKVEVEAVGVSQELPPEYLGEEAQSRC